MFYINTFVLFSFLGFFLESFVYKWSLSRRHSGALYGPYTLVYGLGFTLIIFIFNNLKFNLGYINYLIYYLIFCFICTLCEMVCGFLINFIFHKDMWDYSSYPLHFTKYVCLKYFFVWGLFCFVFGFFSYDFWFLIINIIPYYFSIIVLFVMVIDLIFSFIKSRN